jgi:hypothetical protein
MNRKFKIFLTVLAPVALVALIMGSYPAFAKSTVSELNQNFTPGPMAASNLDPIQPADRVINNQPNETFVVNQNFASVQNIPEIANLAPNQPDNNVQNIDFTPIESNKQVVNSERDEDINLIASVAPVQNYIPDRINNPVVDLASDQGATANQEAIDCNTPGFGSSVMTFKGNLNKNGYHIQYTVKVRAEIDGTRGGLPVCDLDANANISATLINNPRSRTIKADNDIERHGVMTGAYGTYQYSTSLPVRFDSTQVNFVIKIIDTVIGKKHHLNATVTAS